MTKIVDIFKISNIERFLQFFYAKCFRRQSKNFKFVFKGKTIYIWRAPEPTDIQFQNLRISFKHWIKLVFMTYFITIICLIISLALNFGISYFRKWLQGILDEQTENKSKASIDGIYWLIRILTIIISLLTALVNVILGWIIREQTSRERH